MAPAGCSSSQTSQASPNRPRYDARVVPCLFVQVSATVGLENEPRRGLSLAVDEGFSGQVAAARRPLLLRSAAEDPHLRSDPLRARGTRALYGVPLEHGGRRLGVALMGSSATSEFSEDDLLLFRAMAERAASAIVRSATTSEVAKFQSRLEATPAFFWMTTAANDRRTQVNAGRAYVRAQLAATAHGLAMQPLSQALQEYPEQAGPYARIHQMLAPPGHTVQMWTRLGYGPAVEPAPRRGVDAHLMP